jgi:polysaccharide biosynthesis protein PslG
MIIMTIQHNMPSFFLQMIVRLWVFWLCVNSITVPPFYMRLTDNPHTVYTQHPIICVHTRLIEEVSEWKIYQSLELVREMGADTIVEFFPWAYFEPQKGVYDWERADMIVRHAQHQGINIIARMGLVPAWARGEAEFSPLNFLPRESYDDFANFVAVFAQRYADSIHQLIIWNEPNLAFEWGFAPIDPQNYVDLLKAVYPAVKAKNSTVQILAGALAPTLEPPNSPHGLNDLLYLQALYELGAQDYFDALSIHTYGFTEPPTQEPRPDTLNFRRAELLYELISQYGDGDKPVYITETGWNDSPRWLKGIRPSQRIQYTLQGFEWAEAHWQWAQKVCIWAFRYATSTYSYPDYFTLVTPSFDLKPIYYAIRAFAQGQESADDLWLPPPVE